MSRIEIELQPWGVPNFVVAKMPPGVRQDGFKELPSWPLSAMDASVLAVMCDEFRAEIFRKAGKPDPSQANGEAHVAHDSHEVTSQATTKETPDQACARVANTPRQP